MGMYSRLSRGGPCCPDSPAGKDRTVTAGSDSAGGRGAQGTPPATASWCGPRDDGAGTRGTHREAREALGAVSRGAVFALQRVDRVLSLAAVQCSFPLPRVPCVTRVWSGRPGPTASTGTAGAAAPLVPPDTGRVTCEEAPPQTLQLGRSDPTHDLEPTASSTLQPGVSPTRALSLWDHYSPFHPSARGLRGAPRAQELLWNPKEGRRIWESEVDAQPVSTGAPRRHTTEHRKDRLPLARAT